MNIRKIALTDSKEIYDLVDVSRAQLNNLVWAKDATLSSTEKFIQNKINSQDTIYGVFVENKMVAVLELRKKESFLELGYWIGTPYRHHGYMREAVKMLVDEQSQTVIAHIRAKNIASLKILEHAGLTYSHTEIWQGEDWIHFKKEKPMKRLKP